VLIHAISPAWYNHDGWKCYLNARLWPEDKELIRIDLNDRLRFVLVDKFCVGYSSNFPRYYFHPCLAKTKNVIQCAKCRGKNMSHLCENCKGDFCKIPELNYYCKNRHIIYIAFFSPDHVKVGISSVDNFENRIIEQGPFIVMKVIEVQDKFAAREMEDELSDYLNIPERVSSLDKEEILLSDYESKSIIKKAIQIRKKLQQSPYNNITDVELNDLIYMSHRYNYDLLGKKLYNFIYTKKLLIEGDVVSNIGSLTILKQGENQYILNLDKLKGWVLDTDSEGSKQSRLI